MQLVKSITLRRLLVFCGIQVLVFQFLSAQDNSPYSRYGLGDVTPSSNISTRGMGGISAAYADPLSINFNNPASYAAFISYFDERSKKTASGRVLFDVGLNFDNRTLREGSSPEKFTSSNALFSYMQVGVPLKKNWGMSFGLRQLTRISYKMDQRERLFDPITGNSIDSALTEYNGDGGAFLASVGTGFSIKNLSVGFNFGYLFGKKEYSSKRMFINDTVSYYNSNYDTKASFGNIYGSGGVQYKINLSKRYSLRLGAYGNLQQEMNAEQDILRQTYVPTQGGDVQLDSVQEQKGIKGKIIYPSGYAAGFVLEKGADLKNNKFGGWLIGVDYIKNNWSEYRYYGAPDSVQDNWEIRAGVQLRPEPNKNYFSNVSYRFGFKVGQDYIHVGGDLPVWGLSFGMGLPIASYSQLARGQASIVNVSLEYAKRGNNDNLLKENIFSISVGLSLTDLWFVKRKYE